jgi:hypothetical protein
MILSYLEAVRLRLSMRMAVTWPDIPRISRYVTRSKTGPDQQYRAEQGAGADP